MTSTQFKTPQSYRLKLNNSDSEESASSDGCSTGTTGDISIVTLYDDLYRMFKKQLDDKDKIYDAMYVSAEEAKLLWLQWKVAMEECERLQNLIETKTSDFSELERNLIRARNMLDEERKKRKIAEMERDECKEQISKVFKALFKDNKNQLAAETREQLASIHPGRKSWGNPNQLSAINEVNTTGSILSDFSYSRSEDDLDSSRCLKTGKTWKKLKPTGDDGANEPALKKRRSSSNNVVEIGSTDTVRATTTVTVSKEGPITATSIIESLPIHDGGDRNQIKTSFPPVNLVLDSWAKEDCTPIIARNNLRQHYLQQKTVVMPDNCMACEKRVRFGKTALRCKECKSFCHIECSSVVPLPCIPLVNTPNHKKATGTVSDYTPTMPPMVPSLVVHCTKEVEHRGLQELGVYRIPGSEKEVKSLKERLLTARIPPNMKEIDIHVICGCLKDFLRSLSEPLVTYAHWKDFVQAVQAKDPNDCLPALYQAISELPQPNRDTLAYMILHLQKVAESPECKMPIDNISKIFGPTLIGYSSEDLNPKEIVEETRHLVKVMESLMKITSDYWTSFVNINYQQPTRLQQTPSTDSLLRPTTNRFFTPRSNIGKMRRKKEGRIFGTPPTYK